MPSSQVTTFQTIAPHSAANITPAVTIVGLDDALADRRGDVQAEHHEGDEIEERRPEHRVARA